MEKTPNQIIDVNSQLTYTAVSAASELLKDDNKSVKTPVSLLQEICTKSYLQPPIYEHLAIDGHVHEPTFIFRVLFGDIEVVAKGSSKKRAKHAAALEALIALKKRCLGTNEQLAVKIQFILDSLNALNSNLDLNKTGAVVASEAYNNNNSNDNDLVDLESYNPVGELLETTQKFQLRPPEFIFGDGEGPPHNRQFVCFVTFGDFKEAGYGRAKKLAKRQAAFKLLNKLKPILNETGNKSVIDSEILHNQTNPLIYLINKDKINNNIGNKNSKNLVNSFTQFKASNKKMITQLLSNEIVFDENTLNRLFLEKLAAEENFQFRFIKIPNVFPKKECQPVLLQVLTNPVSVFHGEGKTLEEALEHASYVALCYIKLYCTR